MRDDLKITKKDIKKFLILISVCFCFFCMTGYVQHGMKIPFYWWIWPGFVAFCNTFRFGRKDRKHE